MNAEIEARITADMEAAAGMELSALLGYLAGYTAKFDAEIARGEVTREGVRAFADRALERAHRHRSATS
jgi:hypothetical protein